MKKNMTTLALVIVLLLFNGAWAKDPLFNKDIDLDDGCRLLIRETNDDAVILLLRCTGQKEAQIKIEWADIREENVQRITLSGKVIAYFITAWDRSSTYGAQTNVIVWKSSKHWRMVEAPFVRGFAEDRNKDGIYELIDYYPYEVVYTFKDGEFVKGGGGTEK